MATEFSIGVIIGGAISGAFRSAMQGTQRTLTSLGESTQRLQAHQTRLTQAMTRYGHISQGVGQRLNAQLAQTERAMTQLQHRQTRLTAWSAAGDAARTKRMALYAKSAETYALTGALAVPVVASVKEYAHFEAGLRDIAVTGDLDKVQEQAIGNAIREAALKTNQMQETLLGGVNQLVADGMNAEVATKFVGMLGKTATATKADMTDLAKMTHAFSDTLKITDAKELEHAFEVAATGAKLGSFELKDMAKSLPSLAKAFAAKGIVGQDAITQIVASLEVAKGSGSAEEAVTNMNNWLAAMNRQDTIQKYGKAGINYEKSMLAYSQKGFSQYEASLMIANRFIDGKGKAFLSQWEKAGKQGDQDTQQKLMESFGLAEVFTDIQTVNHLLSMRQNWDKYLSNKKAMTGKDAEGTLDKDFAKQNDTLAARWHQMKVGVNASAISIGEALSPILVQLTDIMIPVVQSISSWVTANPVWVKGIVTAVGAVLAFNLAAAGTKLLLNFMVSLLIPIWKGFSLLRTQWLLLKTSLSTGGKLRSLATRFGRVTQVAFSLGKTLSGKLVSGLRVAGQALLWIGRALLTNPIGIALTLIAGAAYVIYRNWAVVSGWFKARWADIKTAFRGGIAGVGKLVLNWSPVGLFYKAFAGVMAYFNIELPATFTAFGGNLIEGLVNGIKTKWEKVKSTVTGLGDSISGWFKDTLGIHSPSRVFMGFGENIAQGAVLGLQQSTPFAALAGQQLAYAMTPAIPRMPEPHLLAAGMAGRSASTTGSRGDIQVSFNPQFYLNGKERDMPSNLSGAVNLSLYELEKMLQRLLIQQQRRGYD